MVSLSTGFLAEVMAVLCV